MRRYEKGTRSAQPDSSARVVRCFARGHTGFLAQPFSSVSRGFPTPLPAFRLWHGRPWMSISFQGRLSGFFEQEDNDIATDPEQGSVRGGRRHGHSVPVR
ncbi:hypothetical protein GCM10010383_03530 [Streptomyces lomondensis]|uniref:Uncharacterized protein n=1 Tax=Streptomyces lomondensis TaxID=68229 RepID=A0ABQ2WXZ8_9ACTN|nr:hypothetical protein GCM10010383_03530 [Streptomyces lomondensis]